MNGIPNTGCKDCEKDLFSNNYKILLIASFLGIMSIYGIVRAITDIIFYLSR
jgi:hypothetical protein